MGKLIFSIIVPVYNSEKYLSACVESLLSQTNQEFEILLINDGSTDNSGAICEQYANSYEKIRVFHKENGGASSARNFGIEHAIGKKILFIDGDDTVEKDLLETIYQRDNNMCQMMLFGMSFDYYQEERLERTEILTYPKDSCVSLAELGEKFEEFFKTNSLSSACNKVFLKEIIDHHNLRFDEQMHLYEDFAFVSEYLKYTEKIECISKAFYHYRLRMKENHLGNRVSNLERLLKNLHLLEKRVIELKACAGSAYAGEKVFEKLYMQLLYLHILHTEMIEESVDIIQEELSQHKKLFIDFETSEECGVNEKEMLDYVKKADKTAFVKWAYKKQRTRKMKNAIRPVVRLVKRIIKR